MALGIKYYLVDNALTPDPNDQFARATPRGVLNLDDIVARAIKRGTTINEQDFRGAASLLFNEAVDAVAEGFFVNTPLVNIRPSITGVFTSATDNFDPSRHLRLATASPGIELLKTLRNAGVERVDAPPTGPNVIEYKDVNTGTYNATATKGGIGELVGSALKFNPANAAEGIFFVPTGGGAATKVDVVAQRTEKKLVFLIPASLASGDYRLEVRRAYTAAGTIRTGEAPAVISVT